MNYIIEAKNLTREFTLGRNKSIVAVNNVNLQIEEGEIFCVMGHNGAGKTTLLKLLCGLIIPSAGKARVCGLDIPGQLSKLKSLIGVAAFGENSFFGQLNIRQNLEFFSAIYGLDVEYSEDKIKILLDILELREAENLLFNNLSTGLKQRLSIARALLNKNRLLFLDEPAKSQDARIKLKLHGFLKEVCRKNRTTIFYITHDLKEARDLSDRIAVMDRGILKILNNVDTVDQC